MTGNCDQNDFTLKLSYLSTASRVLRAVYTLYDSSQAAVRVQYPPQRHLIAHCRSQECHNAELWEAGGKSPRPATCDLPPHLVQVLLLRPGSNRPFEMTSVSFPLELRWSLSERCETPSTKSPGLMNRRGLSIAFDWTIVLTAACTRGIT